MVKWLLTYERYALTLVIRKTEIKATKRHQYMTMVMAKKESKKYGDSDNKGHLELSCTIDKHLDQYSHLGKLYGSISLNKNTFLKTQQLYF